MKALWDRTSVTFLVLIILYVSLQLNFKKFLPVYIINTLPPYHIASNHPRWNTFNKNLCPALITITTICIIPWIRISHTCSQPLIQLNMSQHAPLPSRSFFPFHGDMTLLHQMGYPPTIPRYVHVQRCVICGEKICHNLSNTMGQWFKLCHMSYHCMSYTAI